MTQMARRRQLRLAGRRAYGRESHNVVAMVLRQLTPLMLKCTADRQPQVLRPRQDQAHHLLQARGLAHVSHGLELVGAARLYRKMGRHRLVLAPAICVPSKLPLRSVVCGLPVPRLRCSRLRYGNDHVQQEPLHRYLPRTDGRRHLRRHLRLAGA